MKIILTILILFSTIAAHAQAYATLDLFAAHRTQAIEQKTGATNDDANTAGVSATAGYLFTFRANDKLLQGITELNTRVPLDQTNAVTTGFRAGVVIPVAGFRIIPMAGVYTCIDAAVAKPFTLGASLKIVKADQDFNWYIEPSFVNNLLGLSAGCFLSANNLFKL